MSAHGVPLTVLPSPVGARTVARRQPKTQNRFLTDQASWLALFEKLGMNAWCRVTVTRSDTQKRNLEMIPLHDEVIQVPDPFMVMKAVVEGHFLNITGRTMGDVGKTSPVKVLCIDLSKATHNSYLWTVVDSLVLHFHIGDYKYTLCGIKHVSETTSASQVVHHISDEVEGEQAQVHA